MGYDIHRFRSKIYDEVVCVICMGVLDTPVEIIECGHLFCERCLRAWLAEPGHDDERGSCPIDRNEVRPEDVRPAPEFITTFIGKLMIECDFASVGCIVKVPLAELGRHRAHCPLNPMKPIACSRGCGIHLPPSQMLAHRCDLDLCQDAIMWNDIIENAKNVTRRRSEDRLGKTNHTFLSETTKKLVTIFTKWLGDPRFQIAEEDSLEQLVHMPQVAAA